MQGLMGQSEYRHSMHSRGRRAGGGSSLSHSDVWSGESIQTAHLAIVSKTSAALRTHAYELNTPTQKPASFMNKQNRLYY